MDLKSHLDGKEPAPQGESAAASSVTPVHRAIAQRLVAKLRVKQRIEQVIASGKLAEATTQIHQALTDYPNDADIVALEDRVRQARERGIQAYQLMEEGRQLCDDQKFEEGIEVLRSAHAIDEHDPQVRSVLIDNLLCYSLAVLETNVALAEKLAQEASALDPKHPVNQSVIDSIQEYKRSVPVQDAARPPLRVITAKKADAPGAPLPRRVEAMPSALAQPAPPPKEKELVPNRAVVASAPTVERPRQVPPAGSSMAPAPTIVPSLPIVHASPEERSETASGKATGTVRRKVQPQPNQVAASPSSRVGTAPNGQSPVVTDTQGKKSTRKFLSRGSPKVWTWAAGALVGAVVLAGLLFKGVIAGRQATPAPTTVSIRTTPPGAIVHINGEAYDITHPVLLRPGSYHLEASLDGFRPAVQDVDIAGEAGAPIDIHLVPVAPMLQIATDLRSGTVTLDGQAAGDLANGQFAVASLAPGGHLLRVASGSQAEAVIQFAISPAGPPVITNVVGVKNLSAVIVGNFGQQGRVYASFGPATVRVDGNIAGTVAPAAPVSIENLSASSHELVLDEGKTQRQIVFDAGVTTGLFVSLTSADRNVGALEIASNEPGFDVRIDGKAAKVSTRRGRYFVDNVDAKSTTVQVSKAGFDAVPAEQVVNVRKGATSRVSFKLSATPTQATIRLADLLPGTHVVMDEHVQQLQSDGSMQANVAPGEHTVELTRPGYKPKGMRFSVKAGQLIAFGGSEVSLKDALTGRLGITSRVPASAVLLLRKEDAEYAVSGHDAEVPEGLYTLVAKASGFRDEVRSVKISAETPVALDIKLTPIAQPVRMEGWENAAAWKEENGWYSRKGGEFVMFKGSAPAGTVEFVARRKGRSLPLFKGGQVRWITNYVNASNYDLYELDGQKLTWSRIVNGKVASSKQAPHGVKIKDDTYRVMVEVGTPQASGRIFDGASWRPLPALAAAAPNAGGRFGFYLPGNDEILLSDFIFKPTE